MWWVFTYGMGRLRVLGGCGRVGDKCRVDGVR